MKLHVRYFASVREGVGVDAETLDLAHAATLGELRQGLAARGPQWRAALLADHIRAAVNFELADDAATLKDGDELAFFPPVTGG